METNDVKKSIVAYYIALFFESLALSFPHAVLTIIFLSKGILIYEIALIQTMYSIAIVIFEIPSGVLADKYQKKYVFMSSDFFLMGTYILILRYNHLTILMIAWFLYGISQALKTGTLDSQIILLIRERKSSEISIERFISTQSKITSLSAIVGSGIGFFLYSIIDINIYYVMILSLAISFFVVLFFFNIGEECISIEKTNSLKTIVIKAIKEIRNNKMLQKIMLGLGIVQMYMQIHFQLWQAYFLTIGIEKKYFYLVYLLFQFTSFIVFSIKIESCILKYLNYISIIFLLSILLPIYYNDRVTLFVTYLLVVIIVSMYGFYLNVIFGKIVKKSNISSITSLMSTVIRLFGFVMLSASAFIIKQYSINTLYLGTQFLVLIGLYFIIKNDVR